MSPYLPLLRLTKYIRAANTQGGVKPSFVVNQTIRTTPSLTLVLNRLNLTWL